MGGSSTWQDRMGREMDIKNIPRVENLIQNDSWKVDARIKNDIENQTQNVSWEIGGKTQE